MNDENRLFYYRVFDEMIQDADDPEALKAELERMEPGERFNAWLEWEGIIGYTDKIMIALDQCGFLIGIKPWIKN